MKIIPESNDEQAFVSIIEQAVNGILRRYSPKELVLVKIDNWFGSRWLGFRGKFMGVAGVTSDLNRLPANDIAVPPFVPQRVISQRHFIGPAFEEVGASEPIHRKIPSREALRREAAAVAPEKALVWYSGNSRMNGRGSLMAYLPLYSTYWPWFIELKQGDPWRVTETRGIKREDFAKLLSC